MNPDLVRLMIIAGVALALYYAVNYQTVIENQGEVNITPQMQEVAPNQETLPKYVPAAEVRQAKQVPSFRPGFKPQRASQLNIGKQNVNILPPPQISHTYAPQQGTPQGNFQIKTDMVPALACFPKDTVTPQDLMPREDPYNTWSQVNPSTGGHLADRNFLESGHHFGIDTQSNSFKNPNLQLRSDPVIPQIAVGPWMQSTYGADTNRRHFDIGGDY